MHISMNLDRDSGFNHFCLKTTNICSILHLKYTFFHANLVMTLWLCRMYSLLLYYKKRKQCFPPP